MILDYNAKSATGEIVADYRWKKRIRKNQVELVRCGKHLLYKNQDTNGRWVIFPLDKELKSGVKYSLSIRYQTNFDKVFRVYAAGKNNSTQLIAECACDKNQWTEYTQEFTVELEECNRIFITATDFELSGEVLAIEYIRVDGK